MADALANRPSRASGAQLILLFHGVGGDADSLLPVASFLETRAENAWIVSVEAPDLTGFGGRQWFPTQGATHATRFQRIEAAMPAFASTVKRWQTYSGVGPANTTLVGFSQGAVMSLATLNFGDLLAHRIVSVAGRMAKRPMALPTDRMEVHLFHGDRDDVIPAQESIDAAAVLSKLSVHTELHISTGVGHAFDRTFLDRIGVIVAKPIAG